MRRWFGTETILLQFSGATFSLNCPLTWALKPCRLLCKAVELEGGGLFVVGRTTDVLKTLELYGDN